MFLVVVVVIWAVAMGGWWAFSKAAESSDIDRFKSRLLGTAETRKSKKDKAPAAALLQSDGTAGLLMKLIKRAKLQQKLQDLLEQAGLKWTSAQLIRRSLMFFLVVFAIAWFMLPAQFTRFAALPAIGAFFLPILQVMRKRSSRMRRFEELFPDSLEFVSRSMRAGHAFSVSLEMIHREFQEPLAGEFRRAFEEHNLGLPLDVALQKLAVRVPSLDVHFFVSAVLLQKRTGGNLAEILDKLAQIIRERFKLRGKIRAISAHGRMTGMALTLIPVGVGGLMFVVNPDYVKFFFFDEVGNYMLGAAVALQLIGYAVIQKIVKIEV
ncbi:MAG: type II secretion system F family protein [Acidobacteriaceae bacterium]|nr:type II secretion system F family protein [Acidobacteriaceae bacterium]